MIRLVYSNRTEELLAELATRVRAQQLARRARSLPVSIVVPSAGVEAYVRLGIAREQRHRREPRRLAPDALRASNAVAGTTGARVADAAALEAMALALLLDDALARVARRSRLGPRLPPRRRATRPTPMDVRRVQLASRIGRLFEEYTYSRGDMLTAWCDGPHPRPRARRDRALAARLWLAMFGERWPRAQRRRPAGAARALHEAVGRLEAAGRALLPRAVHVFGFAHVGADVPRALRASGRGRSTSSSTPSARAKASGKTSTRRDPAPLHLWAARAASTCGRSTRSPASTTTTASSIRSTSAPAHALRQLQSDVLRREHRPARRGGRREPRRPRARERAPRDRGRRERYLARSCEANDDAALRRRRRPRPRGRRRRLRRADRRRSSARRTTCRMQTVGLAAGAPSRVVEAVELLLALPLGRFTRQELLRLALHPASSASLDDVDPARWVAWCDALGVVHGADRTDHDGTYIERDILNWDQGLRRLALGAFMAGDASGDRRPSRSTARRTSRTRWPAPSCTTRPPSACSCGRSSPTRASPARQQLTLARVGRFLRGARRDVRGARRRRRGRAARARACGACTPSAAVDLGGPPGAATASRASSRASASARTPVARGGEGVVVSTLAAIRPLPFRVVFACGMGEGRFPSPDAEDPLDLRWARRREGDVTARERDSYGFLELLLGDARSPVPLVRVARPADRRRARAFVGRRRSCSTRSRAATCRDGVGAAPPPPAAPLGPRVLPGALRRRRRSRARPSARCTSPRPAPRRGRSRCARRAEAARRAASTLDDVPSRAPPTTRRGPRSREHLGLPSLPDARPPLPTARLVGAHVRDREVPGVPAAGVGALSPRARRVRGRRRDGARGRAVRDGRCARRPCSSGASCSTPPRAAWADRASLR